MTNDRLVRAGSPVLAVGQAAGCAVVIPVPIVGPKDRQVALAGFEVTSRHRDVVVRIVSVPPLVRARRVVRAGPHYPPGTGTWPPDGDIDFSVAVEIGEQGDVVILR